MSSLSGKSDKEISQLLDEYGIKHGPIVDSTRKLYEKKLNEAMAKNSKTSSPDKTYYREEQEEVEYVTYHHAPPVTRNDGFGDVTRRSKFSDYNDDDDDFAHDIRRSKFSDYRDDADYTHDIRRSKFSDYRDEADYTHEPSVSQTRTTYQSLSRPGLSISKSSQHGASPDTKKSGGVPGWLRVLAFIIIAIFLYYVYSYMEPAEESPFRKVE